MDAFLRPADHSVFDPPPDDLQMSAIQEAVDDIERYSLMDYQFLFSLAGRLRGCNALYRWSDEEALVKFLPAAIEFGQRLSGTKYDGYIDFGDPDAVELEFRKAWKKRRLPKGTDIFEKAVELSKEDFLEMPQETNRWVVRIVNLAFALDEMLRDCPMLIPVTEKTAAMLGTSIRTLSLALQRAIDEGFICVKPGSLVSRRSRKARQLLFNAGHPWFFFIIGDARDRLSERIGEMAYPLQREAIPPLE
ncbi:hypothetical protein EON79_22455 [bacterium]|nr:MAG: hypothetical protein EON79_22455 [bacterium]